MRNSSASGRGAGDGWYWDVGRAEGADDGKARVGVKLGNPQTIGADGAQHRKCRAQKVDDLEGSVTFLADQNIALQKCLDTSNQLVGKLEQRLATLGELQTFIIHCLFLQLNFNFYNLVVKSDATGLIL